MPTKYKIFLGKGVLPPYNPRQGASPLDPCKHLVHRLSFSQFKIGGSMESLVEMVRIENSLQNYVNSL